MNYLDYFLSRSSPIFGFSLTHSFIHKSCFCHHHRFFFKTLIKFFVTKVLHKFMPTCCVHYYLNMSQGWNEEDIMHLGCC